MAVIREREPLMLEEGDWAYERLLLSGAMNAPSSLLSRDSFSGTGTVAPRERELRLQFPAAEPSGKFQRKRIETDPILPPLHN